MRVRSYGFAILALGILIGAGGCSSDSPTSPLAPTAPAAEKGGYLGTGSRENAGATVSSGGYLGTGSRNESGATLPTNTEPDGTVLPGS